MNFITFVFICLPLAAISFQNEISQEPQTINRTEGQSGTIRCSVKDEIDIRELWLTKRLKGDTLFKLWMYKSLSRFTGKLKISGKFTNFTVTPLNGNGLQKRMKSAQCFAENCGINGNLDGTGTIHCKAEDENVQKMVICEKDIPIIDIMVHKNYTESLNFSGTIRDFSMTFNNLKKDDDNGFHCEAKKEDEGIEIHGRETKINILNGGSYGSSMNWISVILLIASPALF